MLLGVCVAMSSTPDARWSLLNEKEGVGKDRQKKGKKGLLQRKDRRTKEEEGSCEQEGKEKKRRM
eukprot:1144614-Pelagomonas_calceolata.AAC.6